MVYVRGIHGNTADDDALFCVCIFGQERVTICISRGLINFPDLQSAPPIAELIRSWFVSGIVEQQELEV